MSPEARARAQEKARKDMAEMALDEVREARLSFERAADFDFETASFRAEVRYGELRRVAVGYLDGRLHVLCYIPLGEGIRVISFRKANIREARKYGKAKTTY
jgi:uncharacterized DUF497 family protein